MIMDELLTSGELHTARLVAAVLLPGTDRAPAALDVKEFDESLMRACDALGPEIDQLRLALKAAGEHDIDWESMRAFAADHHELFEVLAAAVSGAYFTTAPALDALNYPHGARKRPSPEQIVDEIETGILEPVMNRSSMVRALTDTIATGNGDLP